MRSTADAQLTRMKVHTKHTHPAAGAVTVLAAGRGATASTLPSFFLRALRRPSRISTYCSSCITTRSQYRSP
jgi:hypothetical protein